MSGIKGIMTLVSLIVIFLLLVVEMFYIGARVQLIREDVAAMKVKMIP